MRLYVGNSVRIWFSMRNIETSKKTFISGCAIRQVKVPFADLRTTRGHSDSGCEMPGIVFVCYTCLEDIVRWLYQASACVLSDSVVSDFFATPWAEFHQDPLSMKFSKARIQSGFQFPHLGIFQTQGQTCTSYIAKQIVHQWATWGSLHCDSSWI